MGRCTIRRIYRTKHQVLATFSDNSLMGTTSYKEYINGFGASMNLV